MKFLSKFQIRNTKYKIRIFRIPVQILELLWNRLHIVPIEWLIGDIDVFLSSDWLEPPTVRAKKVTTLHDLSVLKFPDSYDDKIKTVHARKLKWAMKECDAILCDSKATKKDAIELLGIDEERLKVVYLGIT
ncbi:glycosyltransferase [Candidatus Roizmanbacteria bacterium]|nr:glycosyltransferase [Candidatus Roizmanbacteria bacterium]